MKIGAYDIAEGAALAPMAGITNPPFRMLCRELGASMTVTELISAHALSLIRAKPSLATKRLGTATLPLLAAYPGEHPLAVQIFGRDPALMALAAAEVVDRGADIVDLNFGCPARKVVKNGEGSGAALLRVPSLVEEIAKAVVRAVPVPVTAKIRLGWSGDTKNAPEVAKRLESAGTTAITVHARTRDQVHSGPADLAMLAEVCEAVSIPIIGNGGIRNREDAETMMARTGCARVAVGQASRGNPWVFREIAGGGGAPTLEERIATCRRHLSLYVEWAGEHRAVREIRKHVAWYLKGFPGAAAHRARINTTLTMADFERILDEILSG